MIIFGKFSDREIKELGFASILVAGVMISLFIFAVGYDLFLLILLVIGGILSFLIHEISHKLLAKRYGYQAEFVLIREGVIMTAISIIPLFPLKFIGPGAVMIQGFGISRADNGRTSLAGPLSNLILAGIFLSLAGISKLYIPNYNSQLLSEFYIVFYYLAFFSLSLAVFNLIPFPPMDGYKVFIWNKNIFFASFGISAFSLLYILFSS